MLCLPSFSEQNGREEWCSCGHPFPGHSTHAPGATDSELCNLQDVKDQEESIAFPAVRYGKGLLKNCKLVPIDSILEHWGKSSPFGKLIWNKKCLKNVRWGRRTCYPRYQSSFKILIRQVIHVLPVALMATCLHKEESWIKIVPRHKKHLYILGLAGYGLSSVTSPLQLSFAVPWTKEDAVGGAFDPPLDMAGGTADMAGEEEKGSNTCKSNSTVFSYPPSLTRGE